MSRRQAAMLIRPTVEECCKAAVAAGMPEREGDKLFVHYEMVGWVYGRAKVPISSLALVVKNWKHGWEDRGKPGLNGSNGDGNRNHVGNGSGNSVSVGLSGADKMIRMKEYERVIARMKVLVDSVDSHSNMRLLERQEYGKLKAHRAKLRLELGLMI